MKRIATLLVGLLVTAMTATAQDGIFNGIMVLESSNKDFDLKTTDNIGGTLNYHVELYTDGNDMQYCLTFAFDESKKYMMIPTYCTLLLKTKKEDVIELRALYTYDDPGGDKVGWAYFPISEEDLGKIVNDGVIKFRMEVIATTDHHKTLGEKEWKMDSFGASIKSMVADVDKQWEKKKKKFVSSQKDIHSEF